DHRAARLGSDVAAALEDLGEELGGQFLPGPAHQVERHHGDAAHGVDVREGIGGGDPAPVVGVVDHRGEEVRGGQDRQILADLDGGGVVAVIQADEDFGAGYGRAGQTADRFLELTGGNLARAPAPVGETRQPDRRHAPTLSADASTRSPDLGSASTCPECRAPAPPHGSAPAATLAVEASEFLVGSPVFKTGETEYLGLAGSIP